MKVIRAIAKEQAWRVQEPITDVQLLRKLKLPGVQAILARVRLTFIVRLLANECKFVFALLQGCDRLQVGWTQAVRQDLHWLQGLCRDKVGYLPDALSSVRP